MDWSNESYVRLYVRDTKTWIRLGWEGQVVLTLALRKLDRAGLLDDVSTADDLAVMLGNGIPVSIVEVGLSRLLDREVFVLVPSGLLMPHFIEAQESRKSDPQRQRESREKKRAMSRFVTHESRDVTLESQPVTFESHSVTTCHNLSQPVTLTSADPLPCSALPCSASSASPTPPEPDRSAAAAESVESQGQPQQASPKPPARHNEVPIPPKGGQVPVGTQRRATEALRLVCVDEHERADPPRSEALRAAPAPANIQVSQPATRRDRVRTEWSDLSIRELAIRCRESPYDAAMAGPETRPEVLQVQRAWCEAVGLPVRALGSLSDKNHALNSILRALETYSLEDVLRACAQAKNDDWAQGRVPNRDGSLGKKCRLEWMSVTVISRLLDAADANKPEARSPRVQKAIDAVEAVLAGRK